MTVNVRDNGELIKMLFFTFSPLLLGFYQFTIIAYDFLIFIHITELAVPTLPISKKVWSPFEGFEGKMYNNEAFSCWVF